jgi:basic membrane protein A
LHVSKRLVALGAASAILIAACGGTGATTAPASEAASSAAPSSEAPASESAPAESPSEAAVDYSGYKACVAFDTGGLGDKGFNDLAKKGLEDAGALGFQTAFSEAQGATDYAANIQRLMDEGCQSIITVGFNQAQATIDAVKANPDVAFAQVDAVWDEAANGPTPANFSGLDFQIDEAATLAGYLAAGFSKSGIIGTFVGGDNPWGDPAKGEQLAKTFLDQGADIVHPVAGATGNGTIKAMLAAGKWAIGVDTDQAISLAEYAPAILTSAEKVIDVAVLDTFKKNAGGDLGGENFVGTLANAGVRLSPFHDRDSAVSAELKAEVEQLSTDIAAGTIKVADYLK